MDIRGAFKVALANLVPTSVYLAINTRVAARNIVSKRRWAPEIDLLPRFVRAGDTVIDVGGNHGLYTYHLSRLVGPSGRVHTFEPMPPNLDVLRYTVHTHRLNNVTVHPSACGESQERTTFCIPLNRGILDLGSARRGGKGLAFECDVVRLDDVIAEKVSFLKIDVEGAELFVLRGAERILRQFCPAVILFEARNHTCNFGYRQEAVFEFLSVPGYNFLSRGFRGQSLAPRSGFTEAEDYFCVHMQEADRVLLEMPVE
jgi:FkbM family methyltransferase